jgi:hypothetical protein
MSFATNRKLALLAVLLATATSASFAQTSGKPEVQASQAQGIRAPENTPDTPVDKTRLADMKADLRQKQLAEDTAKLLVLANELKAEMDKSTKDTLSLGVIKKAEQVEKLAHKVRDEMRASLTN